jgi:DNA-binding MarR family transcriptional regulator
VNAQQIREVLTDTELTASTRLVWAYLNLASEPQNSASLGKDLGFSHSTVSRHVGALKDRGLLRRSNGVWLPEPVR